MVSAGDVTPLDAQRDDQPGSPASAARERERDRSDSPSPRLRSTTALPTTAETEAMKQGREELREWLGHLQIYLNAFLAQGYDCLETLQHMNEISLQRMFASTGVTLPGHQELLRRKIRGLKGTVELRDEWAVLQVNRAGGVALPPSATVPLAEAVENVAGMRRSRFSNEKRIWGLNRYIEDPDDPYSKKLSHHLHYIVLKRLLVLAMIIRQVHFGDALYIAVTVLLTWLLQRYDLGVQINPSLYLTVIVFPLSFAVNSAFHRREQALHELANLKANVLMLYRLHVDWTPNHDPPPDRIATFCALLEEVRAYCQSEKEKEKEETLYRIYGIFATISRWNDFFVQAKIPPPIVTRPIHMVNMIIQAFENVRVIADYRTPFAIRSFIKFSIMALSLLLTPYFSYLVTSESRHVTGYIAAGATVLLFHCLQNVQKSLEHPFGREPDSINMRHIVQEFEAAATTPLYMTGS